MKKQPAPTPHPELTRREFITRVGGAAAVLAAAGGIGATLWRREHHVPGFEERPGLVLPSYAVERPTGAPTLAIAHGADTAKVVAAAIGELGGIEQFIRPGDVVLLKPNSGFDRPAISGATTHPEMLRAVAQLVLAAGAARVIVADNPINSPAGAFIKNGLRAVADELGLRIILPDPNAFVPIQVNGRTLRQWPFFERAFRRVDKVIGLAPCKDHNACEASMTMKNWYGLLGGRRDQFHQSIHEVIADFALMIKPTLVILDGMRVMVRNGPTGGRPSDLKPMNMVIAGTDMVAVDACGTARMLGRDLARIDYLALASERGLGNMDWKSGNWREAQT